MPTFTRTQAVINTIEVESLVDSITQIERVGGKKVQGPNQVPGIGTTAYCADPEGNLFGLIEPVDGGTPS